MCERCCRAQKSDELSFPKHAIITNVVKQDGGWWKGDYGGKKEQYFPANFVTEVDAADVGGESLGNVGIDGDDGELAPLGRLQKGCIDIAGKSIRSFIWVFALFDRLSRGKL